MSVDDLLGALFGDEDEEEIDLDGDDDGENGEEEIEEFNLDTEEMDLAALLSQLTADDEEDVDVDEETDALDEAGDDDAFGEEDEADDDDDLEELALDEDDFEDYEIGGGVEASCPHCGEAMEIFVDPAGGAVQDYVEDCSVCCRPSTVRVTVDKDGISTVDLEPLD